MTERYWFALKLVLTLAVLWWCLSYVGWNDLITGFGNTSLFLLVLATILNAIGTIVIPSVITKVAVPGNRIDLRLTGLIALNFALRFYVLILPRAAAVAIRWWRYRQAGRGDDALALLIFERVVQVLVMAGAASVFLGLDYAFLPPHAAYIWAVILLVFTVAGLALSTFLWPTLSVVVIKVSHLGRPVMPAFVQEKVDNFILAIQRFHATSLCSVLVIVALSALGFLFFVVSPYLISLDMGLNVSFWAIAWIRVLVFFLTLIPVTIGGIGVREAGLLALLQLYGVTHAQALGFALTLLAVQLVIGAIGAALELWRYWFGAHLLGPRAVTLSASHRLSTAQGTPVQGVRR